MTAAIVTDGKAADIVYGGTSATATFPNSHTATAGRLLIMFASTNGYTATYPINTPAGWTADLNFPSALLDKRIAVFKKVAAGGETGGTFTQGGAADATLSIAVFEISGADAAGIVAGSVNIYGTGTDQQSGAATTIASTAIDPASTLDVLFLFGVYVQGGIGALSHSNSFVTSVSDTGRGFVSSRTINNPGSTTTTATYTNAAASVGIVVAIPSTAVTNTAPIADAGADQFNVSIGTDIALDGSNSHDAETAFGSLTFAWHVQSAGTTGLTDGDILDVTDPTTLIDTSGGSPGTATIRLTVTDAGALTGTDDMVISLITPPAGSINGYICTALGPPAVWEAM